MGKDRRGWRKLVKKLRRKRIRSEVARNRDALLAEMGGDSDSDVVEEWEQRIVEEAKFYEREKQAQLQFEQRKAEEKRLVELEEEKRARIRKEWDELQTKQEEVTKAKEKEDTERRERQVFANLLENIKKYEQEFNEFLDFLAGDIETPPVPYLIPDDPGLGEKPVCPFFERTAACRFGIQCTRLHPKPALSQCLLIPNFFNHFSLEQTLRDEYDTDLSLEYEDAELYREFLVFYYDVLPEFQKFGDVIQFKVCCNYETHLRGNVYVQYKDIRQAVEAYRSFNGRFFNGKQLSLEFVKIESWRTAICGLFCRKRCPKKRTCSYLHVFRSPTKEFVSADNDWKPIPHKHIPASSSSSSIRNRYSSSSSATPRTTSTTVNPDHASHSTGEKSRNNNKTGKSRHTERSERSKTSRSHETHRGNKKHKKKKSSKKSKKKSKKKDREKS